MLGPNNGTMGPWDCFLQWRLVSPAEVVWRAVVPVSQAVVAAAVILAVGRVGTKPDEGPTLNCEKGIINNASGASNLRMSACFPLTIDQHDGNKVVEDLHFLDDGNCSTLAHAVILGLIS